MRMAASRGLSQGLPASNRIVRGGYYSRDNNEFAYFSVVRQNIGEFTFFAEVWIYHTGQEKMIKTISLSMCLAASSLSLNARAQDERAYTEGPVTEVDYIQVEYGRFETYIDWLNSTWKPTMEATKKAGLIIDYKVFRLTPNKGVELEAVAKKVICSTECQNKARVTRNEYRKVLGTEYVRELILK
jgi:hypothetical protein